MVTHGHLGLALEIGLSVANEPCMRGSGRDVPAHANPQLHGMPRTPEEMI